MVLTLANSVRSWDILLPLSALPWRIVAKWVDNDVLEINH
jgi:hypothetical protein